MSTAASVLVLADHSIISALPFFVPSLLILGAIGVVMLRDRRRGDVDEPEDDPRGPAE